MNAQSLHKKVNKPLSDADIREYLPDAKIITYSDLEKYESIDQLLPKEKDYVIILYEYEENSGHWTCLLKYDNTIEFFDPLGNKDKTILGWIPFHVRKMLNEDEDFLTDLLEKAKSKYRVVVNKLKVENNDASTCGRHVVFRILSFLAENEDLPEYQKQLLHLKKRFKNMNYDEIITQIISV
jgi:hypothetical protein